MQSDNEAADASNLSPFESIMKKCENQQFDYMALFQDPLIESDPINSIYFSEDNSHSVTSSTDLSSEENESLSTFVHTGRRDQNLALTQKYAIALVWVLPKERQLFNLFHEVLTVDTIHGTNNETRSMLTIGGKDSNGNMFIILRCFLPHEKGWMFRWVSSLVLPNMYGKIYSTELGCPYLMEIVRS